MNVAVLRELNSIRTDITLGGSNQSFVVEAENNEFLVVKPHNPDINRWLAPNELICGLLGRAIGGPFLPPYLVELDEELIELSGLRKRPVYQYANLKSGIGFSIEYFAERREVGSLSESQRDSLNNPEQAIHVLTLDAWVHNLDRNNGGNLIFVPNEPGKKNQRLTMYAIDQELAFDGLDWGSQELHQAKPLVQVENRLSILEKLSRRHWQISLEVVLQRVEAVSKADLKHILAQLPTEWDVSELQKEAMLDYLLERQKLIRPVFERFFGI